MHIAIYVEILKYENKSRILLKKKTLVVLLKSSSCNNYTFSITLTTKTHLLKKLKHKNTFLIKMYIQKSTFLNIKLVLIFIFIY